VVNVIWGMTNLVVGYFLICAVGDFVGGMSMDALIVGLGVFIASVGLGACAGDNVSQYPTGCSDI
jgi:hypothetical protein